MADKIVKYGVMRWARFALCRTSLHSQDMGVEVAAADMVVAVGAAGMAVGVAAVAFTEEAVARMPIVFFFMAHSPVRNRENVVARNARKSTQPGFHGGGGGWHGGGGGLFLLVPLVLKS
jgi:hypothetical protein